MVESRYYCDKTNCDDGFVVDVVQEEDEDGERVSYQILLRMSEDYVLNGRERIEGKEEEDVLA